MREILLLLVVALVAAAIVFGVIVAITGAARGLQPAEPDERARRLPGDRPLAERDLGTVRFDAVLRGYRMAQVDAALRRVSYDLGYKQELIAALEAEVAALRDGRTADADLLRDRRLAAAAPVRRVAQRPATPTPTDPAGAAAAGAVPAGEAVADAAPIDEAAAGAVPADEGAADAAPIDEAAADTVPVDDPAPAGDPAPVTGAETDGGAQALQPADRAEPDDLATAADGAESADTVPADEGERAEDAADDPAAGRPDTDGSNGRADGAARRVAGQPAVS
ncbi:DivIVA domain-containing protein [Actinocatenispora sera]|uniref:DivIVA domain-containing protein n=1 Tax=Actinocatenispora sera TaxID=390989 RepID=A0A810L233_9ACTN|nr:DivIVA domain-containing protein [Actinocatenispora sera]BCJ28238.1 hypothetical protein Asera_23460 [Actinocatenispora sera]